jgi:hypothetical protein
MRFDNWPISYQCLKTILFSSGDYTLRPIHIEDSERIRIWRNSQMTVLRQNGPLDRATQLAYFNDHVLPCFFMNQPKQLLFSFQFKHSLIGYGGLVHIDWTSQRGEMSFLIKNERVNNSRNYSSDLRNFIELIKKIAEEVEIREITTETYSHRVSHILLLESSGFMRIAADDQQFSIFHKLKVESHEVQ